MRLDYVKRKGKRQQGFSYIGLLIVVALLGLASSLAVQSGVLLGQRDAEEALLAIGMEYRHALISYANATPAGQSKYPPSLDALLKDPRYPGVRRHLRQIYVDPITGRQEWGMVAPVDGPGIAGIYSLAQDAPIKIANFVPEFERFTGATSYRSWVFSVY